MTPQPRLGKTASKNERNDVLVAAAFANSSSGSVWVRPQREKKSPIAAPISSPSVPPPEAQRSLNGVKIKNNKRMQYCSIVIRLITLSRRSQQPVCSVVEFCLFGSHLQNSSTDVSAAGLTFHPILGVVIRLAVGHSIPATHTIKTVTCARNPS